MFLIFVRIETAILKRQPNLPSAAHLVAGGSLELVRPIAYECKLIYISV